jgi:hypothetical protein
MAVIAVTDLEPGQHVEVLAEGIVHRGEYTGTIPAKPDSSVGREKHPRLVIRDGAFIKYVREDKVSEVKTDLRRNKRKESAA